MNGDKKSLGELIHTLNGAKLSADTGEGAAARSARPARRLTARQMSEGGGGLNITGSGAKYTRETGSGTVVRLAPRGSPLSATSGAGSGSHAGPGGGLVPPLPSPWASRLGFAQPRCSRSPLPAGAAELRLSAELCCWGRLRDLIPASPPHPVTKRGAALPGSAGSGQRGVIPAWFLS